MGLCKTSNFSIFAFTKDNDLKCCTRSYSSCVYRMRFEENNFQNHDVTLGNSIAAEGSSFEICEICENNWTENHFRRSGTRLLYKLKWQYAMAEESQDLITTAITNSSMHCRLKMSARPRCLQALWVYIRIVVRKSRKERLRLNHVIIYLNIIW